MKNKIQKFINENKGFIKASYFFRQIMIKSCRKRKKEEYNMNKLQEMRYKDTSPEKTVKRLKEILKDNGIEVEENWKRKSSVGTYSLRLCIKGTNLGQNGKGMTKDFAAASAYAEFFERYQNGILVFRQEKPNKEFPFIYSADEKALTTKEILDQNDAFINAIFEANKDEYKDKEALLKDILGENSKILKDRDKHICLPHYSVKDKKVVYLPHVLSCHLCGTNGMCAGNTKEEAMIEGICEILERYVSMQLIYKRVSLPEIPDSYISKFPKVEEMLIKLKNKEGYVCKLLDCSFGGKYPVAGLVIIEKNTGRFGFKLGAHPDYGIAMERCFTEAAQGMDIYDYSQGCLFDFKNEELDRDENIREFVNCNVATIPYQVFAKEKTYPFTELPDVSNLNNKQMLNKLVNSILSEGYDILIRDVSSFGFPSFRIIIPKMTEITHSKMAGRFNMFEEIEYLLKDLKQINLENLDRVIEIMETEINEVGYTSLYTFMNVKDINLLPCEKIGNGAKYFLAICYIMKGDYAKAEKALEDILFVAENLMTNQLEKILLQAVYYYASAMNKLKDHEKVMYYINMLFDKDIANAIDDSFKQKEKILVKHYAVTQEDYVDNDNEYYLPFMKKLKEQQKKNVIDQEKISKVF